MRIVSLFMPGSPGPGALARRLARRDLSAGRGPHPAIPKTTRFPFPPGVESVTLLIDYQNLLIGSARIGTPLDLERLATVVAGRFRSARIEVFTTCAMAPAHLTNAPGGVAVAIHAQEHGKNCDIALAVHAMNHLDEWRAAGDHLLIGSGDGDFLPLAAECERRGGLGFVGFLVCPGASTSSLISRFASGVGVLGQDVLGGQGPGADPRGIA